MQAPLCAASQPLFTQPVSHLATHTGLVDLTALRRACMSPYTS
jgi:hypothetical protein